MYRLLIQYDTTDTRAGIDLLDERLIQQLDNTEIKNLDQVAKLANRITRNELSFIAKKASHDPNVVLQTRQANCIGYSALFHSIADYVIKNHGLQDHFESYHRVGQLKLLGFNLHTWMDDPFFSDHDFNELRDKTSGESLYYDPNMGDYLNINEISVKE